MTNSNNKRETTWKFEPKLYSYPGDYNSSNLNLAEDASLQILTFLANDFWENF